MISATTPAMRCWAETGCRLATAVRDCDVIARMGGDEFVVLLPGASNKTSVESVSLRILKVLAEPVIFGKSVMRTSASIGVSLFPDHGTSWQQLYKAADTALYEAKRNGRAASQWYEKQASGITS